MTPVIVVGAGAAGLMTAITVRRQNPTRDVLLLDGAARPGAKILISGGSRCNVTNAVVTEADFWGGRRTIIRRVLRAFPVPDTIAFFRELGVSLHEEAGGKLFPDTNTARDVLSALRRGAADAGVSVYPSYRVEEVRPAGRGYTVVTEQGELGASAVVLATGGQSLPKTGSDGAGFRMAERFGHRIVPTTPALVPLVLDAHDAMHRELTGVSQDVSLDMWVDGSVAVRLDGALLWTHFGVSGPVVLNASRHWLRARLEGRDTQVTCNFLPGERFETVDTTWSATAGARPRASVRNAVAATLPASVADALLRRLGIDGSTPLGQFSREPRRRLVHALVSWPLAVVDSRGYNYAEATAGGVAIDEIDPASMESRLAPRLFLVGEMLDVDGRIGGFNFQWAWASGYAAGAALARISLP
jgi:hypothetical protein